MKNLKLNLETILNIDTLNSSVAFWNREGARIYSENKAGKLGSKDTQEEARNTSFDLWLLEMIASDFNTIFGKDIRYTFGRSGSHCWVCLNGKRVVFITVKEEEVSPEAPQEVKNTASSVLVSFISSLRVSVLTGSIDKSQAFNRIKEFDKSISFIDFSKIWSKLQDIEETVSEPEPEEKPEGYTPEQINQLESFYYEKQLQEEEEEYPDPREL